MGKRAKTYNFKPKTLCIAIGLNGHRLPHHFGVVVRRTAGPNFLVNTESGPFIYTGDRIIPILEGVCNTLDAKEAWRLHSSDFFEAVLRKITANST